MIPASAPLLSFTRQPRRVALAAFLIVGSQGCRASLRVPEEPRPMHTVAPIPRPASLIPRDGPPFVLTAAAAIVTAPDSDAKHVGDALGALLRPATGFPLAVVVERAARAGDVTLALDPSLGTLGDEGYELDADASGLRVRAFRAAGLFHGVQTVRQMLPVAIESEMRVAMPWTVAPVHIRDVPRFAWRGAMLDVARHFFTVREVEQFIDILALYKMNTLHLHLSDDQGWRIEIASRPLLTQVGGATQVAGRAGGFYTQQDYAAIVRYAQARYVTIVPEIDMPGHTNAALAAYPALSCSTRPSALYTRTDVGWSTFCVDREDTYALVDDVVRELAAITPGPFIHLGGDEVHVLTPAQYTLFIERVQDIVARHGKRMIGWEEIARARLAPSTVVQHWHSDSLIRALPPGSRVVMSPAPRTYLDMKYVPGTELGLHWAGYVPVRAAYEWDPATQIPGVTEASVVGVEAPLWSETVRNITAAQYLVMPRLPALAEVGWSAQSDRAWDDFAARLASHAPRWRMLGINYYASEEIAW